MQVSRNNLLFVLLFAGGIVLPTAILSVLSFRNIQNEIYLSQKNFDENLNAFQNEVEDAIIDGPHSIVYDEAENRLHTAKAVMALTMGGRGRA